MHILTKRRLKDFWQQHSDAETSLQHWYTLTNRLQWENFVQLRQTFPSADQVGKLTVFNIGGNKYRLIARVEYIFKRVYVREILTHSEYDKGNWKNDPWF